MDNKSQKALVVHSLNGIPVYESFAIPQPKENQVLIKVLASTINPSDKINIKGGYGRTDLPFVAGLQGFGEIISSGSSSYEKLVGTKVAFFTTSGSWTQYTVATIDRIWEVDSDVPIQCAASGIVNPLTVLGIVDTYINWNYHGQKPKGLINTAAASSLGRMLNKYCQREGVPLLNVVRRKEQAKILEEEGAKFIIDTSNEGWVNQYVQLIKIHGFNVLFDAVGGGEVTQQLISNLEPRSQIFIYGQLSKQPFIMRKPLVRMQQTSITSFMLFQWYERISQEQKSSIKEEFSSLLKNQLSTVTIKKIKLQEVPSIWSQVEQKASEGKFTIIV